MKRHSLAASLEIPIHTRSGEATGVVVMLALRLRSNGKSETFKGLRLMTIGQARGGELIFPSLPELNSMILWGLAGGRPLTGRKVLWSGRFERPNPLPDPFVLPRCPPMKSARYFPASTHEMTARLPANLQPNICGRVSL